MVIQRKEPTVSSVLTSKEEQTTKHSHAPINRHPRVVAKKSSSSWVWLAILLALIAASIAGFSYWQLMQAQIMLQDQQMRLQNQQGRIAELENRLALSDDESTQSLVAVSTKLKEVSSEIKKLWGVSYDTNRKAITENKAAITSQEQNYQALKKTLETQQTALNNNDQRLLEQGLLMNTLRERVDEQGESLKSESSAVVEIKKRVKNNEEAVVAFDIFRQSVSRDLLQIKQQLNSKPPVAR
jgi:uncharacterized protein HemX